MPKKRVFVAIDGSNFYHRLKELKIKNLLNFDFSGFVKFLVNHDKLLRICYYVGFSHKPSFALIRHAQPARLLTADDLLPFVKK